VALGSIVAGVRIVCRIEVAACRDAIGRRTIAKFVNMEPMLARREAGNVSDNFYFVARPSKRHCALYHASFGRV
jgi:hypothetical protein